MWCQFSRLRSGFDDDGNDDDDDAIIMFIVMSACIVHCKSSLGSRIDWYSFRRRVAGRVDPDFAGKGTVACPQSSPSKRLWPAGPIFLFDVYAHRRPILHILGNLLIPVTPRRRRVLRQMPHLLWRPIDFCRLQCIAMTTSTGLSIPQCCPSDLRGLPLWRLPSTVRCSMKIIPFTFVPDEQMDRQTPFL